VATFSDPVNRLPLKLVSNTSVNRLIMFLHLT